MEFHINDTIKQVLQKLINSDKFVDFVMHSGKVVSGTVQAVGQHVVSIKQRGDKSFYDAFVRIDQIAAVEVRMRES